MILSRSSTSKCLRRLAVPKNEWANEPLLCRMLEDSSFAHVVSWNSAGDAFVVKVGKMRLSLLHADLLKTLIIQDMNEFTKSILPRMFKHSNFASFVRQLNKYDFHKVKNSDENQYGDHVRLLY